MDFSPSANRRSTTVTAVRTPGQRRSRLKTYALITFEGCRSETRSSRQGVNDRVHLGESAPDLDGAKLGLRNLQV